MKLLLVLIFVLQVLYVAGQFNFTLDSDHVCFGSKLVSHFSVPDDRKSTYDWIGVFYRGACIEKSDCQINYVRVSDVWEQKTASFDKLQVDKYDIRYLKKDGILDGSTIVAKAEFEFINSPGLIRFLLN
jgi:hypothetical protein